MTFKYDEIQEFIRLKDGKIEVGTMVFVGKDGDFFVQVSPGTNVSGYGHTETEADESFKENMTTFLEDLINLPKDKAEKELVKMGYIKEASEKKNFNKLYVDENGILQEMDPNTIKRKILQASV